MPMFDTVIRNGTIVDGRMLPRYRGDIGISDGRIAGIGRFRDDDGARGQNDEGRLQQAGIKLRCHRPHYTTGVVAGVGFLAVPGFEDGCLPGRCG